MKHRHKKLFFLFEVVTGDLISDRFLFMCQKLLLSAHSLSVAYHPLTGIIKELWNQDHVVQGEPLQSFHYVTYVKEGQVQTYQLRMATLSVAGQIDNPGAVDCDEGLTPA